MYPTSKDKAILGSKIISLNKFWNFKTDPENIGLGKNWHLKDNFHGTKSSLIKVPSCWEEEFQDYEGVGWYETSFDCAGYSQFEACRLKFEASNYITDAWVNGHHIGKHEGGYTPFNFDIPLSTVRESANSIVVRVISPIITKKISVDGLSSNDAPHWRGGLTAGIWQNLNIEFNNLGWIEDTFYKPVLKDKSFILDVNYNSINKDNTSISFKVFLKDPKGSVVLEELFDEKCVFGKNLISRKFKLKDLLLWDCENPNIYSAQIQAYKGNTLIDNKLLSIGFKEFTYKNGFFFLNGEKIFVKGGFWEGVYSKHQSYPDNAEEVRHEIELAKKAGFNLLRPWRRPVPPIILDEADKAGLLIIGSPAVECMSVWPTFNEKTPERIQNEIVGLIKRDRNHPSIIWWELFNEVTRDSMIQLIPKMVPVARECDPTRLILDESGGWASGAHFYSPWEHKKVNLVELHSYVRAPVNDNHLKLYRELGQSNDIVGRTKIKAGDKIFISEFGYGGLPNLESTCLKFRKSGNSNLPIYRQHFKIKKSIETALKETGLDKVYQSVESFCLESQKIQATGNRRMLEALLSNELINGYCIHAFTDGDWILGAGLLDSWLEPKKAYHSIKDVNSAQPPLESQSRIFKDEIQLLNQKRLFIYDPSKKLINYLSSNDVDFELLETYKQNNDNESHIFISTQEDIVEKTELDQFKDLFKSVKENGSVAIFLEPPASRESPLMLKEYDAAPAKSTSSNLLLSNKVFPFEITCRASFGFWEPAMHVVLDHPIFKGMPTNCMMDEPYQEVAPLETFYRLDADDHAAKTITWFRPEDDEKGEKRTYLGSEDVWHGSDLAIKNYGQGKVILSSLILKNKIGKYPIANAILKNMINYAETL